MSGRDYKAFVTNHRHDEQDKLLKRVEGGLTSNKYKQVDYGQLKALAAQKKFLANKSLVKVKKIEHISKQSKQQSLIKAHKHIWQKELIRLNGLRRHSQDDMNQYLHDVNNSDVDYVGDELLSYLGMLESNLNDFKNNTVKPIWDLREDVQFWLHKHKDEIVSGSVTGHEQVTNTIEDVKEQQANLLQQLYYEELAIHNEIKSGVAWELSHPAERRVEIGVPDKALTLHCPDEDLKSSVLEEFHYIDARFTRLLEELEFTHESALNTSFDGWDEEDHNKYIFIIDQYPHDMNHRWRYCIDRLMRVFPYFSRSDLMDHDKWWTFVNYYKTRRQCIIVDWQRDRTELMNKAEILFTDLCDANEHRRQLAENRREQDAICASLYEKVKLWREHKSELMKLEEEMECKRRKKMEEKQQLIQEKEDHKRNLVKEQIKEHHDKKETERLKAESLALKRMEELRKILDNQAEYDHQRLIYREEQVQLKLEEKRLKDAAKIMEEEEKERRLEALRKLVRVESDSDPDRLLADTQAWLAHKEGDELINMQKPLFEVNTFTSKQIMSDGRVRLENQLREAGVHNSDYARTVLARTAPPTQPRKDMESTLFARDGSVKKL